MLQTASWVNTTIVSISVVSLLWMGSAMAFSLARRFHWLSGHRHSRLSRGLQVLFGGLLLMAVFLPYLAIHHPVVAVGVFVAATITALVFGARPPHDFEKLHD